MSQSSHDPLAWRLAAILKKLNDGEQLDVSDLAEEFGTHKRTIQRDLLERFAFLPICKVNGLFTLEPAYLGRITMRDIERFAGLAGLRGLFPGLDTQFIRELFDSRLQDTFEVHDGSYEDLQQRLGDFRLLQNAIKQRQRLRFGYRKLEGEKQVEVDPYRLINHAGIWYLAAADQGRIKAYAFGKIVAPRHLDEQVYEPDPAIEAMLDSEDSIWLNQNKTEVVLTVAPAAAIYFRRRKLIAQQVIEKELEDGGLIVSGKFAHPNQILPIVRYWIPHVRIVSPKDWQDEMERQLNTYLDN